MQLSTIKVDALIDESVARVNASPREPHDEYDAPPSVRVGASPDAVYGRWDWHIRRWPQIDWVEPLEAKLPQPFPKSFRSLVTRYIFPQVELGSLQLLANTPESVEELYELRTGIFEDKYLSECLLQAGFVQFARPAGGGYNPICFDTNRRGANAEYPVVIIDHEAIFCHSQIKVAEVSPSFISVVMKYLEDQPQR